MEEEEEEEILFCLTNKDNKTQSLIKQEPHLTATECRLPYEITCHPTQVNTPCLNPSQTGRYSIYLPRRDRRLS